MSEITREHVDWAVVSRLAEMLDKPHSKFNVTLAYGLLTPIICWILQSVRAEDERVESVSKTLKEALVVDFPWNISNSNITIFVPGAVKFVNELSVYDFLIGLRNAIAHGDGVGCAHSTQNQTIKIAARWKDFLSPANIAVVADAIANWFGVGPCICTKSTCDASA